MMPLLLACLPGGYHLEKRDGQFELTFEGRWPEVMLWEYEITRGWADARVQRIYGGTNEIMKELISRTL